MLDSRKMAWGWQAVIAEVAGVLYHMAGRQTVESAMKQQQANNPLHGLTLEKILLQLVEHYGWEQLACQVRVNCFKNDPSVKSSLKFLRKTPWARAEVEQLYVKTFHG